MKQIIFKAIPFQKKLVTLALESGVDAILTEASRADAVRALGRVEVLTEAELPRCRFGPRPTRRPPWPCSNPARP